MTFTFYNDLGRFKLSGSACEGFCICSVSGLEPVSLTRTLETYIGEDGCVENSSHYGQRIITISGDLKMNKNSKDEIRNAMRVLSRKCTLTIDTGDKKRCIDVNASTFTLGKKYSKYQTFVIQLISDYPHFTDENLTGAVLFKKDRLLSNKTVFPAVLSRRTSSCTLENNGDLTIYPVITITKKNDIVRDNEILIENKTTGKKILLNKTMSLGEVIVVDIKNRRITSSIEGNILGTLNIYSSLSDFFCDVGENLINVSVNGEQTGVEIMISHFNEYLEAI